MRKTIHVRMLLLAGLLLLMLKGYSQDAVFSQYYSSALYLNPALGGTMPHFTFSSNNRTQWRSIVIPYVTNQVSLVAPLYGRDVRGNHIGGIGLSFYNDRAGEGNFKTNGLSITAAYNVPFDINRTHVLTFGVQAGFIQKNIDLSNLQWGEQFNPYIGYNAVQVQDANIIGGKRTYPDINAGMLYSFGGGRDSKLNGFLGVAAYHMNKPNESLVRGLTSALPILYKAHAGLEIKAGERFSFSPNILYVHQRNIGQINSGMYLTWHFPDTDKALAPTYMILGGWYRLDDAAIFSTGLGNENYTLGFSYDFNTSSLRYKTKGRGAYEISLALRIVKDNNKVKIYHTPRI